MRISRTLLLLSVAVSVQCGPQNRAVGQSNPGRQDVVSGREARVQYRSMKYGFCVSLPESWNGYSVVLQKWSGSDEWEHKLAAEGPIVTIRHPQWTPSDPRQDIPIMVFTQAQWNWVQHEKLVVSAAPFPPGELGRNTKYVFALPPRYNYAFPTGYEEVEIILRNGAFRAPCPTGRK